MAEDGTGNKTLAPPAVTALKQQAAATPRLQMERSISEDIRVEREDLQEAAERTLNVVVDLGLNGKVRWVSPSWTEVIGTSIESIKGKPISEIVPENPAIFADAVESMKKDDSKSHFIRFSVRMGPLSLLRKKPVGLSAVEEGGEFDDEKGAAQEINDYDDILNLEGQGIMVYDRSSGGESHTMWMLREAAPPTEVTIDLPPLLVESLGVGAEMLANYLTSLAEVGANDPAHHPPPMPILCRICERPMSPFWFEKHSDLCLQEHKAEMEVQIAHDALIEHRHAIVKVLDALEARQGRPPPTEHNPLASQPEYKGLPIGPSSSPSSHSGSASPAATPPRSRDPSISSMTHSRGRSFAVRRPLSRIVELVLDLCDTATEISIPAIKDARGEQGAEIRTQSPQSEARVSQVLQWQSPSSNTLEHEHGLAALCLDTEKAATAKVEAVLRHRRILEYSERIRIEFTVLLDDCIAEAIRKAQQIAEGDLSSSTEDEAEDEAQAQANAEAEAELQAQAQAEAEAEAEAEGDSEESVAETPQPTDETISAFASAFAGAPSMASVLRNASDPSLVGKGEKGSNSVAVSSRSSSPMECPTPRSHKSALGTLTSQPQTLKRGSMLVESDTGGDSDSSMPSSVLSGPWRTESPGSEQGLSRAPSTRDRKRRSLILPGLSASPRRTQSPARNPPPSSPLRMNKPRLPSNEHSASPMTSPLLAHHEFASPALSAVHHRRQSSATSSDIMRPPQSPRLTSVSHPQPRAQPPSIKDFEIIKPISKGAFGSVYLSKKKATGEYFAIKVLKKADMVAKNQVTNVKAERAIMMWQGESDFVAKLYWTFSSKDYLYLVMEYLNGGDCASLIKVLGGLPEDWSKKYLAEVVLGVQHLHGRGIVHRDLKPDNLLIDQKGHLKLTDFGLSRMGLVGRQKHALKHANDSQPDLLKTGQVPRSLSVVSSRSASFDFQGTQSPNSTPLMTPDPAGSQGQPSYFNLNRESTLNREHSRRQSGYRSDSGGSDSLHSLFRTFSLHDPVPDMMLPPRSEPIDEETHSEGEGGDSPDFYALQPMASLVPPQQTLLPMLPPPMALYDPEDHNRRFVGTPDYLAPETINGVGQDEMSDWWSLGCIMFEFLYGHPPFHADTPDEVFENILARKIDWPLDDELQVSADAKDLMNRLMTLDPQERLGSNSEEKYGSGGEEIQNHPWFQEINWSTLLEDEAQFVPAPENPEDTEYFDARGAILQPFSEELEDQTSSGGQRTTPSAEISDRPHDALAKVRNQVNTATMKRGGLMPLHIPPHVRDPRSRRLSEPVIVDDFGNFTFKNLPVLEKANKDVLSKLRADTLQAQQRAPTSVNSPSTNSPAPSLEGSPLLPGPLKRALSTSKGHNRPASPSNLGQNNSSPNRPSQPSSPLIIQFATGQNHERRKTSSTSSSLSQQSSHQSSNSLQPGSFFDAPHLQANFKTPSAASSPIKTAQRLPAISPENTHVGQRQSNVPSRTRSQTVGSQESDALQLKEPYVPGHHKRRSGIFDVSPSSSDNEDPRAKALLRVQRRRQSSRRMSQIAFGDAGPTFRPLDVLICEDHPVSKLVMERHFEKLRCRTITATNGSEAMRYAISEIQFDIITMEYKLPQVNGADVARAIRSTKSANSHTPIICITGYLKELPDVHHFDHLIEKMPTMNELTEVLCKFCQWKPPPPNYNPSLPLSIAPSSLRQESGPLDYSPSSTSSSFAPMSSYRGSTREDSISSAFTDPEATKSDEIPGLIISRQATDDWGNGGLGISEEVVTDTKPFIHPALPHLIHTNSAPPVVNAGLRTPRKQRSIEGIKAKRESMERKRYECAESGDDEDEELGDVQVRARSPQGKQHRVGSKLGTEMMRTNSRGSVVSGSEELVRKEIEASGLLSSPPPSAGLEDMMEHKLSLVLEDAEETPFVTPLEQPMQFQDDVGEGTSAGKGNITPPVIFPKLPGDEIKEIIDTGIDADATPKPLHPVADLSEEPTPRAEGSLSTRGSLKGT